MSPMTAIVMLLALQVGAGVVTVWMVLRMRARLETKIAMLQLELARKGPAPSE